MDKPATFLIELFIWTITLAFVAAVSIIAYQLVISDSVVMKVAAVIAWLGIMSGLGYQSVIIVPKVTAAMYISFGRRICTVGEGLNFRGWWHKIELRSLEEVITEVEDTVTTKDQIRVPIKVVVKWKPDLELVTHIYSSQSVEAITKGFASCIMKEIGIIAGRYSFKAFYEKRGLVDQLLNCVLRMNHPPHYDVSVIGWVDSDYRDLNRLKTECSVGGDLARTWITKDNEVPLERRLEFYKKYTHQIRLLLEREAKFYKVRSRTEQSYGIDVREVNLASVAFTETFEQAMQKEQEAKMLAKAQLERAKAVRSEAQKIKDENPNISEEDALWSAMAAQNLTQHYTFAGGGNVMPVIVPKGGNNP
ncbi:MAG: SPFH domain-containing protein [Patescibacteria group bacterium]